MDGLEGKHILISRDLEKAKDFAVPLEKKGATVCSLPLIRFERWDRSENTAILNDVSQFDWIIFTSANGVKFFLESIKMIQQSLLDLKDIKFAVVGNKTEAKLLEYGFNASFIPETFDAKHFSSEFIQNRKVKHILLVKGNLSRRVIDYDLEARNIKYTNIYVYQTLTNNSVKDDLAREVEGQVDGYAFTSPSSLNAFHDMSDTLSDEVLDSPCFCIGETTQTRAIELGFKNTFIPKVYTLEGLSQLVINYYSGKESS